MDVVLGAAVTGPVARLALVDGSATERRDVIDQSTIDVESDPARKLAAAIVGTERSLIEDGHRLAATRVCWSDHRGLLQLRQTLSAAGISDVTSVLESDAAVAMVRDVSRVAGAASSNGPGHAALLFCDDDTATLSIVGADDATTTVLAAEPVEGSDPVAACRTLLSRLSEEPGKTRNLFLMSTSPNIAEVAKQIRTESPVPLVIPDDTDLALAHGATLAGSTALSTDGTWTETALNTMGTETTALSPQIGPQLAYSAVDDSGSLPPLGNAGNYNSGDIPIQSRMSPLSQADDDDEEDDTAATGTAALRPRYLLLGCGVAAAVVVAFAALAITVAIGIRPAASQVALAQPQSHPMPTFLPLPTNVAPPQPLNPEAVPPATPQVAFNPGIGAGQLPGGSGPIAAGPGALPQGVPSPGDIPDAPPPPQIPSWGMPGGLPMPPVILNFPSQGGFGGTGPIWVTNPTNGKLELVDPRKLKDGGTNPGTGRVDTGPKKEGTLPAVPPANGSPLPVNPPPPVVKDPVPPPVQAPHVDPPVQVPAQPPVVPPPVQVPAQPPVVPPPVQVPAQPPVVQPPVVQPPVLHEPEQAQPPVLEQPAPEPPVYHPPQPPVYHPPQPPVYQPAPAPPPVQAPVPQIPSPPIFSPPRIQTPVVPMNPPLQLFPRGHR